MPDVVSDPRDRRRRTAVGSQLGVTAWGRVSLEASPTDIVAFEDAR
jgi:hypothetical protein